MKVLVFSDLHLEFGKPFTAGSPNDVDVVVCAGDVLDKGVVPSIEWLSKYAGPNLPVIFVAGNHEFYRSFLSDSITEANALHDRYPNIHFLDDRDVVIDNVLFAGATLWTDFRLFDHNPETAMWSAEQGMNDYKRIGLSKKPFKKFKPIHAFRKHDASMRFLSASLARSDVRKKVVVTHHAPSSRSISRFFRDDPLAPCYASNCDAFIREAEPDLWVHGHVHQSWDYTLGFTRIVCNPHGYPGEATGFDPGLVIEI
ncbi:Icc-related predicted phosphoesterase [Rhizobium tibeticum]|uniref:metallophosphoesterase n=1 Tax=Rhizobium tibeticum TaxID=501024 RepID=UPI0027840C45|nr:metallophosphoesterase [Rhizobium tibeticum]MDP9808097.1 Icc-related predicted phosphoesterase [Rhizobium tibeticum]